MSLGFDTNTTSYVAEIDKNVVQMGLEIKGLNRKMDKQIALLEKMVEILTKIEERHTDADY